MTAFSSGDNVVLLFVKVNKPSIVDGSVSPTVYNGDKGTVVWPKVLLPEHKKT